MARELTREEKAAIRSLVVKWCANYDRACGCLPLLLVLYRLWILHGKVWCPHIAVIMFIRIHILLFVGVLFVHKSYPLS